MYRALVLVTSPAQAEEFQRHVTEAYYDDVEFKYPSCIAWGEQTPEVILKECREILSKETVDVILNIFPGLELVQTRLARDLPESRQGAFEAAFLCGHRYYSRQIILQGFNCRFDVISLDDVTNDTDMNVFEEVGCPLYIRDTFRMGDPQHRVKVRSLEEFHQKLPQIRDSVRRTRELVLPLLKGQLPSAKYPVGRQPCCVIEEAYCPEIGTEHYVEGCVADGNIIPWAISDILRWSSRPFTQQGVVVPSALDQAFQFQLWAVFREVIDKLQYLHFDNQFLSIQVKVLPNGDVRVLDTQACITSGSPRLYRHVFQHGDNIRAQLDISLGSMMKHPKLLSKRFGLRAFLTTYKNGHAKDILNFKVVKDLIKEHVHIVLHVAEGIEVKADIEEGFRLAEVSLLGTSLRDCLDQMKELVPRLLVDMETCPWVDAGKQQESCMEAELEV